MAVDANVIIYARIREEIAAGISVQGAIQSRFQKSAFCNPGRQYHNADRSVCIECNGYRKCKGICTDAGAWYPSFHVYRTGDLPSADQMLFMHLALRMRSITEKPKARKSINFVGKWHVTFAIALVVLLSGPVAMGINSAAGNGILNLQHGFHVAVHPQALLLMKIFPSHSWTLM